CETESEMRVHPMPPCAYSGLGTCQGQTHAPRTGPCRPLPDPATARIRDKQVSLGIHRQSLGTIELSTGSRPAVAAVPLNPGASHRADRPVRAHFSDAIVTCIG